MQQHTIHFWTCLIVLCSLEQEGGAAVFRGQILSSKSGILWIFGVFNTTGKSEKKKNKVKSWRQWSSGWSSSKRSEFPTWNFEYDDSSKRIFPVRARFFLSSQLSWTHWSLRFPSSEYQVVLNVAEVRLDWQHSQCNKPFLAHGVACECLSF